MPTFIAIDYGDKTGNQRTTPALRDRAQAHDELVRKDGVRMGPPVEPVQVRNTGEARCSA